MAAYEVFELPYVILYSLFPAGFLPERKDWIMIYSSNTWHEDLEKVLSDLPELKTLENKSVMITGAAGLICSSIVDLFIKYNENHENTIHILAAGRQLKKMTDRFGDYCDRDYFTFITYDASKENNLEDLAADYIIHGAGNAYPGLIIKEPVETMLCNFTGLVQLLNYAKKKDTKRVLYISSSEIYGQKQNQEPYTEGEYGYIDLLNPRNSYSVGKRAAETLCASFSAEYGMETVIVRPGHIYGPTASPDDNRVSSAFAYSAAKGEDLVLKSPGSQIRSYCYCLDCASAILKVLLKGTNCTAYNISNPESIITIREMAGILARSGEVHLSFEVSDDEEKKGFNPMSNSSLDSHKLMTLGWKGIFNAEEGLSHTVKILKDSL